MDWERNCSLSPHPDPDYTYNTTDNTTDIYPCEDGFHYLVASSAVWLVFLPFWISALFGNCWRQCCCCCCDPIVLCGTIIDFIKRCLCEVGRFNCCEFVWYSQCLFHIGWAGFGLKWLAGQSRPDVEVCLLLLLLSLLSLGSWLAGARRRVGNCCSQHRPGHPAGGL